MAAMTKERWNAICEELSFVEREIRLACHANADDAVTDYLDERRQALKAADLKAWGELQESEPDLDD